MLAKPQRQEAVQLRDETGASLKDCNSFINILKEISDEICKNQTKTASVKTLQMLNCTSLVSLMQTRHFLFSFYIFSLLKYEGDHFGQVFLDKLNRIKNLEGTLKKFQDEDLESHSKISAGLKRLVGEDKKLCSVDLDILENYFLLESGIFP